MQPQHRATLTQPLQCISQHPVANLHLSTDVATSNDDNEAAIPMQSATRDSRTAWNYAQTQPLVAKHIGGTIRAQNDRSRTRRTHEVPFIVGCSHFTRKNTRFRLRLPPQNIAHATFMQPLQCVSQHPVANPHLSTHVATSNDDNEAAIPMQSATRDSRTA